jgi:hypothetical protein
MIYVHDEEDVVPCKVFGYYTTFDEGPVRTIKSVYLGSSSLLNDAELLMRKAVYPFEFFVIEYPLTDRIVSRYYDGHQHLKFEAYRDCA